MLRNAAGEICLKARAAKLFYPERESSFLTFLNISRHR
jgi:hypothetical protein